MLLREGLMPAATSFLWMRVRGRRSLVLVLPRDVLGREAGIRWTEGRQRASRTPHGGSERRCVERWMRAGNDGCEGEVGAVEEYYCGVGVDGGAVRAMRLIAQCFLSK